MRNGGQSAGMANPAPAPGPQGSGLTEIGSYEYEIPLQMMRTFDECESHLLELLVIIERNVKAMNVNQVMYITDGALVHARDRA